RRNHVDLHRTRFLHSRGVCGRRYFLSWLRSNLSYRNIRRPWLSSFCRYGSCHRNGTRQFFVRQTSSTLEAATQFPESFRTALVACFTVDLLQVCGKFGSAPVIARAKDEVEQFF